jgi:hypothetical protein
MWACYQDRIVKLRSEATISFDIEELIRIDHLCEDQQTSEVHRLKQEAIKAYVCWKHSRVCVDDFYEVEDVEQLVNYIHEYWKTETTSYEIFIGLLTLFQRYLVNVNLR